MRLSTRRTLRHPVAVLAAGWALMLVAWSMANPPFAAPDEPAHYLRAIAVGEGSFGATPVVRTPPGLWARWPTPLGPSCNAGRREQSAECIDDYRALRIPAEIAIEAGSYPPPAYVLPGIVLRLADNPGSAVRAARIADAAVTLAFLVLAATLLFTAAAPLLSLVGLIVAVTPLAIFVGASISNSGLEISAGIAFAAALLRLTRSAERPRWVWAAAVVSAAALVSSRTTGVLWLVLDLALGAALLWSTRTPARSRDVRRPLALLAGVALAGVVANRLWEGAYGWTLTQRGAVDYGSVGGQIGNGIQQIRRLLDEQVGVFGWLDAPMPHAAYPAGQALLAALITLAALVATRRERLVLAGTVLAYMAVGVFFSASLVAATNTDVQGRHVLAFSAVVPLLAGELLLRRRGRLLDTSPWPIAVILVVGTAVLHVVGFAASAYRQAVGTDGPLDFALTGAGWVPPVGWWLWSLVLLAGAGLVVATAFVRAGEERRPVAGGRIAFRCNICGAQNTASRGRLLREGPSCARCGSTVRFRAITDLVTREVLGVDATLPEVMDRPDVVGVGLSDWEGYAEPLARKLAYTNTFFHAEPHLDITEPPEHLAGTCDFVIASEVLEHVPPPVGRSFAGLRRLLRPGGVAIVTVPWRTDGETEEHFPRLHRWELVGVDGKRVLRNVTVDGEHETFDDLVFHGGDGMTLEMRLFSLTGLLRELAEAGFEDIRVRGEERRDFGIVWTEPWSLPVTARAPRS